jgi:hypothetical protein
VLRFTYNRVCENPNISTKDLTVLQKTMNNVEVDSHFKNSAQYDAKALYRAKGEGVVFGGKKAFLDRARGKTTREEFERSRLTPLCSVGEAISHSNRKFQVLSSSCIRFWFNRHEQFD